MPQGFQGKGIWDKCFTPVTHPLPQSVLGFLAVLWQQQVQHIFVWCFMQ